MNLTIEMRVKLNAPGDSTGEVSLWINGILVSHVGPGTTGTWKDDDFFPGVGPAFEGFEWRKSEQLNINFIWLLHFNDHDPAGHVNSVNYDHIVAAKRYIGPIAPKLTSINMNDRTEPSYHLLENYPNPFNPATTVHYRVHRSGRAVLSLYSVLGQQIAELYDGHAEAGTTMKYSLNAAGIGAGVYFLQLRSNGESITRRIVVLK